MHKPQQNNRSKKDPTGIPFWDEMDPKSGILLGSKIAPKWYAFWDPFYILGSYWDPILGSLWYPLLGLFWN